MTLLKMVVKVLFCIVVSLILAGVATWLTISTQSDSIRNGPWTKEILGESHSDGMYARARAFSKWALRPSEAIYFSTTEDSNGKTLSNGCTYRIEGRDPDSRWWSITPYKSLKLISNSQNRYSFSKTTVTRRADGSWTILLSRREQPENWLPLSQEDGPLAIFLRCYNPSSQLLENPAEAILPEIFLEGCQ